MTCSLLGYPGLLLFCIKSKLPDFARKLRPASLKSHWAPLSLSLCRLSPPDVLKQEPYLGGDPRKHGWGRRQKASQQCSPWCPVCCQPALLGYLCLSLSSSNKQFLCSRYYQVFPGSYLLVMFLPVSSHNLLQTDQYLALPDVCFNLKSRDPSHCWFISAVLRVNRAPSQAQ